MAKRKPEAAAVWCPVEDLTPWDDNPRLNDEAVGKVRDSIKRFGFAAPIVARKGDGMVIAGHTRLRAAVELGLEKVPVRWMDLDPADARMLALADNKLGEVAAWDDDLLRKVLEDLASEPDLDLSGLGWEEEDLEAILGDDEPTGPEDGDLTEPPEEPDSVVGEVYELGPHRLICGDSMLAEWGSVDILVTDPPYCSGGRQEAQRTMGSVGRRGKTKAIERDNLSTEAFSTLLERVVRKVNPSRAAYICSDWRQLQAVRRTVEPLGYSYRGLLVWDKQSGGLGWPFMHGYELIFCGVRSWPKSAGGGCISDLLRVPRTRNELHSTEKPVELMRKIIAATPGDVVADAFAGSGTTLIAAALERRRAVVCEFDPGYCDVIRRRWTTWADEAGVDAGPGALR